MFNDKTSLILCTVTVLLLFIGGITDLLSNPIYVGLVVIVYLTVILNLVLVKKSSNGDDDFFETTVQSKPGLNPNDLLRELINKTEVHSFVELVPSINDIFISIVEGGNKS